MMKMNKEYINIIFIIIYLYQKLFQQAVKDWRESRLRGNSNSKEPKETTTIITGTNEEPLVNDKICCWKCYKIFSFSKVYKTIEKEKNFCSEECYVYIDYLLFFLEVIY